MRKKLDQFSQSEPGESANFIKEKKILHENIHIFSPILHIIIFLALNSMEAPKGNWSLFRPSIHAFTTSATTSSALAKSFRNGKRVFRKLHLKFSACLKAAVFSI